MSSIMSIISFMSITLFAATSNAHMILGTPPPYGSPNNSPLVADGSDFPCKSTSNAGATVTEMSIGEQQPLSFIGSAVHGGGSCQISLTTDTPATKSSNWMVIHSIEGGCPAKSAAGNAAEGSSGGSNYTYTIPEGITPGSYTLAWTWFNKIGNREMYMNCASIKVSGGSKKRETTLNKTLGIPELSERATASFPAMFKANIPTTDCTTVDSADVQFPDPGASVEKFGSGTLTPPTGPKCGSSGSSGSNSSASAAGSSSSGSSGSSASGATGASGSNGASGSTGASGGASGPSGASSASGSAAPSVAPSVAAAGTAPSMAAASPAAASPAAASPAAASPAAASPVVAAAPSSAPSAMTNSSSGSTSPSASSSSTGTCSTAGQSICSPDGRQIGECTTQLTVTWIPVAAGTKCVGGYQVFAKRSSPKFQKGYIRRGEALGVW